MTESRMCGSVTCVDCSLPIFVGVQSQASDLSPVFGQLSVTHHGHHVDDVDNRILRAHPHLVLIHSQHAVLRIDTETEKHLWAATERSCSLLFLV